MAINPRPASRAADRKAAIAWTFKEDRKMEDRKMFGQILPSSIFLSQRPAGPINRQSIFVSGSHPTASAIPPTSDSGSSLARSKVSLRMQP